MTTTILTAYRGPTNTSGSRIIAKLAMGSGASKFIRWSWDYELTPLENHVEAACALAKRLGLGDVETKPVDEHPNGFLFLAKEEVAA